MSEETGRWDYPRPSDHDFLPCIGRDLKRLYEDTLQQSQPGDIGALLQKKLNKVDVSLSASQLRLLKLFLAQPRSSRRWCPGRQNRLASA